MKLRSPAFADGQQIPRKYTADGDNLAPPLEWSGVPQGARSMVVVVEDPDAPKGTFRHWAVYDVVPAITLLPEGVSEQAPLGQAVNDMGHRKYDGPSPPKGHGVHHYHFRVAALDVDRLELGAAPSVAEVWQAAEPHVLAQAEIIGTYERA
jgi:hypothetical protein